MAGVRAQFGGSRGFTLVELVIVVVIIGIIAAIAVPRMSRGSESARASALSANLALLQRAIDTYTAEHAGRTPTQDADGTESIDFDRFANRLLARTDEDGTNNGSGSCGPYLGSFPTNPYTRCVKARFDGSDASQNCSWRFVTKSGLVFADHDGSGGLCKIGSHNTGGSGATGGAGVVKAGGDTPEIGGATGTLSGDLEPQ